MTCSRKSGHVLSRSVAKSRTAVVCTRYRGPAALLVVGGLGDLHF